MGWETARGIRALVSLLLRFNLLLLAKSTWKPKAAGAGLTFQGTEPRLGAGDMWIVGQEGERENF